MKKNKSNKKLIEINIYETTSPKNYLEVSDQLVSDEIPLIKLVVKFSFDNIENGKALALSLDENCEYLINTPDLTDDYWCFEGIKLIDAEQLKNEIKIAEDLAKSFSCRFVDWLVENASPSI